jgi:hypothetical protein
MVHQYIFTEENIKSLYEKALEFSMPPVTINEGTKSESLYYPNKPMHDWAMDNYSFEEIIFYICNRDPNLCNAVYDYAHRGNI